MPQISTYSDELTHYGRLGMKWGQHIFGKERYAKMTRKRALKKARKTRAKNLAKKREERVRTEEARAKALTNPDFFEKNKKYFSTAEIREISDRYRAEGDLASNINKLHDERYKKLERGKNYVKLVADFGSNSIDAYNNLAKVYNAFASPESKRWPVIDVKQNQQNQQQNQNQNQQQNQQQQTQQSQNQNTQQQSQPNPNKKKKK